MPLSTNFNVTPYYDDYDEAKGYYRILFKPGYGIQARELTQLQTALQKQIERVGAHSFKNGSKVLGGDITLDTDVHSLQLEMQYLGTNINAASFIGKTIIGETSNARGRIVASQAPTNLLQPILMFHYLGGDTFVDGEIIQDEVERLQSLELPGNYPRQRVFKVLITTTPQFHAAQRSPDVIVTNLFELCQNISKL